MLSYARDIVYRDFHLYQLLHNNMQPSTPSQDTKHKLTPPDPFTTYSRDEEDKEIKIAALTAKVKAL